MINARRRRRGIAAMYLAIALITAALSGTPATASVLRTAASNEPMLSVGFVSTGSTWSYNPYSPIFASGVGSDFVYLPLALQLPPKLNTFIPQLATSWSLTGNQLTVHLRSNAKWQNGQPLTSKDVYDTVLLDGTEATIWPDISTLRTLSPHEIQFTIRKGVSPVLAEANILTLEPYPASIYSRYVSPNLKQEEVKYYSVAASNPTAAASLPQGKELDSTFSKLSNFNPPSMVGDGPFRLAAMNTINARLVKWGGFYGASKIHVGGLNYLQGTQTVEAALLAGRIAFTSETLPPADLSKWLETPDSHAASAPGNAYIMEYNDHRYPLNTLKVRQALSYLFPRQKAVRLAWGTTDAGGIVETHPDGLLPPLEKEYLSKRQIAQLNRYSPNPTRASSLLKSAGFHKSGGRWFMPDGKPFTLGIDTEANSPDMDSVSTVVANTLTVYGIKTSATFLPAASYAQDVGTGNFELATGLEVDGLSPLQDIDEVLGTTNNYSTAGTFKGDPGIGFGPVETVPGLGKVNVPDTIDQEALSVSPGDRMNKLTWDWARLVNQDVPYLQFANKLWWYWYSTAQLVDWPAQRNRIWRVMGYDRNGGVALMLEDGYVRPKSRA